MKVTPHRDLVSLDVKEGESVCVPETQEATRHTRNSKKLDKWPRSFPIPESDSIMIGTSPQIYLPGLQSVDHQNLHNIVRAPFSLATTLT